MRYTHYGVGQSAGLPLDELGYPHGDHRIATFHPVIYIVVTVD